MSAHLTGLGVAVPGSRVDQDQLAHAASLCCCTDDRQRRVLQGLYRRSGVNTRGCAILDPQRGQSQQPIESIFPPTRGDTDRGPRLSERMAMYAAAAPPLALAASLAALRDAGRDAAAPAHLVTVSCTGFAAPGIDSALISQLGLSPQVSRTHIGFMGCHGAMNGLRVANALATTTGQTVLLVCVEICTAHFRYGWDPDRLVANALFADGAAAAVVEPHHANSERSSTGRIVSQHTAILPDSADAMTWRIGDHGFEMTLSPGVPSLIEQHLEDTLTPWLAQHGLTAATIGGWAVHPGGPRVISSALRALDRPGLAGEPSRAVLRDHGNMSSPTVLFILDRLRKAGTPGPWAALAFGPGLTVEALLLDPLDAH